MAPAERDHLTYNAHRLPNPCTLQKFVTRIEWNRVIFRFCRRTLLITPPDVFGRILLWPKCAELSIKGCNSPAMGPV